MSFRLLLVTLLASFFVYVLLLPKQTVLRKVFVLCLVATMLLFAVNPDLSTAIANYFGIIRGVDFLFYLSHLMLLFIAFIYYLKFKDLEIRFAKLVRHVAIHQAVHLDKSND
jgi:hypothetical protein